MKHTAESVTRLIAKDDEAACNALVALFRDGGLHPEDRLLLSFAAQVIDSRDRRKAGTLPEGGGLLSPKRLAVWRRMSPNYAMKLAELAIRKEAQR